MLDENKTNPLGTRNVGCVWEKQGKNGVFYSGLVFGEPVIMVKNNQASTKAPVFVFIKPRDKQVETGEV